MVAEVIAFCGKMGSGKDYQCQKLVKEQGFVQVAFADALREMVFGMLGMTYEEGMAKYDELKRTELYNGRTLRHMLQYLGTEGVRRYVPDFWCIALLHRINMLPKDAKVCISDARFFNEYSLTKDYCDANDIPFKFIFCDYHSDRYAETSGHASEALGEYLCNKGYKDLEEVREEDMIAFKFDTKST